MAGFKVQWQAAVMVCFLISGCTGGSAIRLPANRQVLDTTGTAPSQKAVLPEISDWGWSERVITEDELNSLEMKDRTLNPEVTHRILARMNSKAEFYIYDDIRKHKPLRVPNDFRAYRNWTPLPQKAEKLTHLPKTILVVKDIPFIGWYENGKLVGDSQVGLGKPGEETDAGVYRILEKAVDKYSLSYRNDFGEPAWMPWAMKIYGAVWIHAGDIAGPYCSHGCVMLPMDPAEELYFWTDEQTTVVIVESLANLQVMQPERGKTKTRAK